MGNTSSNASKQSEKQNLNKANTSYRKYRVPEVRLKDRFEPNEQTNYSNIYETSVDKYDYLIIFPLTEGPFQSVIRDDYDEPDSEFITWEKICQIWQQAVPGTDENKEQAVSKLANYWRKRTGTEPNHGDSIRIKAWLTIAREAIVDQLSTSSGLQLRLSAHETSNQIFCRIRAPIKLLEIQANRLKYRLRLKGEIDPGSEEFWNREIREYTGGVGRLRAVEIEEDKKIYTKDEANIILEKLYKCNKISASDLGVDPINETEKTWSRRVHALERIADHVPVYNKFIHYAPFYIDTRYRYLYQTYPSVRGKTLFLAKDRMFLTKSIIDKYFDCQLLSEKSHSSQPVVDSIMALHDGNRGEKVTIDLLQRRWVYFWRPSSKEVGSPTVSHPAYEEDIELYWYLRPFAQPLNDIRDYFGEKIALYFAWFGFYTYYLLIPALLGIAMEVIFVVRGYVDTVSNFDYPTYGFVLSIVLWATVYQIHWEIESKVIALKWGTRGFESAENDRPQFKPLPSQPTIRSTINNRTIANFPDSARTGFIILSYLVLFLCILLDMAMNGGLFALEILYLDKHHYLSNLSWGVSVVLACLITVGSHFFKPVSRVLTDMENHRTETDYEDAQVGKILLFEAFNSYGALFFTAFIKGNVFNACSITCIYDLRQLLIAIILVRVIINILDLLNPAIKSLLREYIFTYQQKKELKKKAEATNNSGNANVSLLSSTDDIDENTDFILETYRLKHEGTFDDYAYAVFQYGSVLLFIAALPVQAVITICENLLKLRLDAWKLCQFTRRPDVFLAEDVGKWSILMEIMSFIGVVVTCSILVFSTRSLDNYSYLFKWLIFLSSQQIIILIKFLIHSSISIEPQWLKEIDDRNNYVEDKWVKGFEDDDDKNDADSLNSYLKGNLIDTIDSDALNLYDLRKGQVITEEEYKVIESLESKRRDLLRELRYAKDKLFEVYKTETYNEVTGVGETKHGLPLGRLSVKVLEIQGFSSDDSDRLSQKQVKVRVIIRGTKQGALVSAGPPVGPLSDTGIIKLTDEGNASINQSLGPFAPIRTQDADAIFEILDMSPNSNEASIANASIKLRELQDQLNHDLALHLKKQTNNTKKLSEAKLFVSVKFEYSKVVPLRNRIYSVQDKLRQLEKSLAAIKSGRNQGDDSNV